MEDRDSRDFDDESRLPESWYNWGREWVFKDTGRHRHSDILTQIGPHTIVRDIHAKYLNAPEGLICLMGGKPLPQLPPPKETNIVIVPTDQPLVRPSEPEYVMIGPIIDHIVAASRIRGPQDWYESELRAPWANEQMSIALRHIHRGEFHSAALVVGDVFGTLFVGFLANLLTPKEEALFRRAWAVLQQMVDGVELISQLAYEFGSNMKETPTLDSIKECNRLNEIKFIKDESKRIGPSSLRLAEQIQALDIEISEIQRFIHDEGLPVGLNKFETPLMTFSVGSPRLIRFIGDVMNFEPTPLSKATTLRYAWWVFDRTTDSQKSIPKLFRLRKPVVQYITSSAAQHKVKLGEEVSRCLQITLLEKKVGHRTCIQFSLKWLRKQDKLSDNDKEQIAANATRDKVEGWYNGRQLLLERLNKAARRKDALIERYLAVSDYNAPLKSIPPMKEAEASDVFASEVVEEPEEAEVA